MVFNSYISYRLEWVESFQLVGESKNRHVEIVYEFGKAPRVPDIVNLFGENILPFIRYREGSKNEWFEENILDENYDMKDIYLNELISERFSWVKDFYIGVTRHPENSWQIYITYARDKKPSMKDMRKLFGVNIASFVDFIPESNADDNELRTSSCFLRAPCSGDPLYVKNEERGTIAILATQLSDTDDHYAVTCYHVCYCESELPDNINDAHKKLKEDCGSKNSAGCAGIGWHYINEDTELGKFERGLYNDSNDIALIKLASGLTCDDATTLLKDGVESELLSKKEVGQLFSKYMKNGKLPKVKKYGSITKETEGELIALSGVTENETKPGMNKGFYRIQGTGGSAFAEPGDSGALVYIVDEGKNLPFAIVSNQNENKDIFYCQNLRKGLEELCSEIEPCLNQCGLKITRLH